VTEELRDPVCGMPLDPTRALFESVRGKDFAFCSEFCRNAFRKSPSADGADSTASLADLSPRLAYFSMEIGIDERLPIYSGGLGILAGDTLRSFADLNIPAVGVSLLYVKGYFEQKLDREGNQIERPVAWKPEKVAHPLDATVRVTVAGRAVAVRAWRYDIVGVSGHTVPLVLLDTNVSENSSADRELTAVLYGGDERYRLSQEIVLGIGGVRMLRALGFTIERYHMNEGHASLLAVELLADEADPSAVARDLRDVRQKCIFTTHTPVPAGHDQFDYGLVDEVLGEVIPHDELRMLGGRDRLNMTLLALNLSHFVNGVAKRHGEVSQKMFPGYPIDSITNGVHSFRWTCDAFRRLYDKHIPGWTHDPFSLRYAIKIPSEELWHAHAAAKTHLLEEVRQRSGRSLDSDALTLGFARRATAWKRADLVLFDPERLVDIARKAGRFQMIFAGKAHPQDAAGKELIRRLFRGIDALRDQLTLVYLEDYDMDLARTLLSGVDLLLNTPLRPLEASGTSGMKAAHNGVPSFSILDGWWIEGHIEGVTGWSIGAETVDEGPETAEEDARDAAELYEKLERVILPLYYGDRPGWIDVMRRAIAINASFFNAHRMVEQYAANAYL